MRLRFLGATKTVTGSKFLLETGSRRILFDCGLFQGLKELRERNWQPPPVRPADVDAVVLTHAHLDHSGYLPVFIRDGFTGPVYCTAPTRDLCAILLPDSGYLQEEEAERANRKGYTKHKPALPLYTRLDAFNALDSLYPMSYGRTFELGDGLIARFDYASHILGAAFVTVAGHGRPTIVFSGDLGRPHDPILQPPATLRHADYLLIESTYGDRDHIDSDPIEPFAEIVRRTAGRGGTLVIPANAVGRTQLLLHYVDRMKREHRIPDLPVWLDSPMATDATELFMSHPTAHRLTPAECRRAFSSINIANSVEESKRIDADVQPKIVISASGMATGGRVLHHIKRFGPDHRNTILFAGYQAIGTRGRDMQEGRDHVRIFGREVEIRAEIETLDGLSAHADYGEMLGWLHNFDHAPRRTFIVHGEPEAAAALQQRISDALGWNTLIPDYGQSVNLE